MNDGEFFCAPCREAIVLRIYSLVDPIDSTNYPPYPLTHPASLVLEDSFEFEVHVMRPAKHRLEVRWWLLAEEDAPLDPPGYAERYDPKEIAADRRRRGKLRPIDAKPDAYSRVNKSGVHRFEVRRKDLEPGRYRLVCRATDTTKLRGERLPWVLKDDYGILESERAWWILIPSED